MDKDESEDILKEIFLHQERLDFTCRFKWTEECCSYMGQQKHTTSRLNRFFFLEEG